VKPAAGPAIGEVGKKEAAQTITANVKTTDATRPVARRTRGVTSSSCGPGRRWSPPLRPAAGGGPFAAVREAAAGGGHEGSTPPTRTTVERRRPPRGAISARDPVSRGDSNAALSLDNPSRCVRVRAGQRRFRRAVVRGSHPVPARTAPFPGNSRTT
jgi:hypothetical protein